MLQVDYLWNSLHLLPYESFMHYILKLNINISETSSCLFKFLPCWENLKDPLVVSYLKPLFCLSPSLSLSLFVHSRQSQYWNWHTMLTLALKIPMSIYSIHLLLLVCGTAPIIALTMIEWMNDLIGLLWFPSQISSIHMSHCPWMESCITLHILRMS